MNFYPKNIAPPHQLTTDRLMLRPLLESDVELDFEAVMASAEQLRNWSQTDWPRDGFTLAENLDDLARHEQEHNQREAFTYTVLNLDGSRCLGCVYITPLPTGAEEACSGALYAGNVSFWARSSEIAADLDRHLLSALLSWLDEAWRFNCVTFIIAQSNERQAALLEEAGFKRIQPVTLSKDRQCWVYRR